MIPRKIRSTKLWNVEEDVGIITEVHYKRNQNNDTLPTDIRLLNVLKNEKVFELFIHWIDREFSLEIIVSFIEFVQFKQRLKLYITDTLDQTLGNNDDKEYVFYDEMLKSAIVYGHGSIELIKLNHTNNETKGNNSSTIELTENIESIQQKCEQKEETKQTEIVYEKKEITAESQS